MSGLKIAAILKQNEAKFKSEPGTKGQKQKKLKTICTVRYLAGVINQTTVACERAEAGDEWTG